MPLRHAKKISRKQVYVHIGGKVFFQKLIGERYSGVIITEEIVKTMEQHRKYVYSKKSPEQREESQKSLNVRKTSKNTRENREFQDIDREKRGGKIRKNDVREIKKHLIKDEGQHSQESQVK